MNQKDYLKKYLKIGKQSGERRKKKKSEKPSTKGLKIIDDDIDTMLSKEIQDDLDAANEDAPMIVAVIDERPPSMRVDEKTKSNLWQPIGEATNNSAEFQGFKMGTTIKLHKNKEHVIDKVRGNKEGINVSIYPSGDSKKIDNLSPERYTQQNHPPSIKSKKYLEEDNSPPRTSISVSPKRTKMKNDYSPARKSVAKSSPDRNLKKQDDDCSPSRKKDKSFPSRENDYSPPRKRTTESSSARNSNKQNDAHSSSRNRDDHSPPRRNNKDYPKEKDSPPRKEDKDYSPKRRKEKSSTSRENDYSSPKIVAKPSPARHLKKQDDDDYSPPRKKDTDYSPPRRINRSSPSKEKVYSPPRKQENNFPSKKNFEPRNREKGSSPVRRKRSRWEKDDSPSRKSLSKPETTMSGKKSGLQSAQNLVEDVARLQQQEAELFRTMSADVSGVNAATVVRRKKQEEVVDPQKEAREKELKEKYSVWGKGIKQTQDESAKFTDQQREMNKPLARYADDEDLERYLKEQEREGDPMLAYIRKKKKKVAVEQGIPEKPMYMGDFMPNRFGVPPGYRWDGVDRSNGYEKKWFQVQNSQKAMEDEALKWSTEDM